MAANNHAVFQIATRVLGSASKVPLDGNQQPAKPAQHESIFFAPERKFYLTETSRLR